VPRAPVAYMYLVLIQGNNIISCNKYLNIQLALPYSKQERLGERGITVVKIIVISKNQTLDPTLK
jgi:hypothetical protein